MQIGLSENIFCEDEIVDIKRCDRCGETYNENRKIRVLLRPRKEEVIIPGIYAEKSFDAEQVCIDLCAECRLSFVAWWNAVEGRYSENE